MQGPRGGNEEQEGGNRLVELVRNRIMQCKEIQSSGIMKEILPKKKEKRNRIENILKRIVNRREREINLGTEDERSV